MTDSAFCTPAALHCGMRASGATNGYDVGVDLDYPGAPAPGNAKGGAYFVDLGTITPGLLYQDDFRPVANSAIWTLEVVANLNPVTLTWSGASLPTGKHVKLRRVLVGSSTVIQGTTQDLAAPGSITVSAGTASVPNVQWYEIVCTSDAPPFSLTLYPGWNMVSLPIEPLNPAVTAIFASATRGDSGGAVLRDATRGGTVTSGVVWGWDTDGSGRGQYRQRTEMHALEGYWVHTTLTTSSTVTITGTAPADTCIDLKRGWNLLGVPHSMAIPSIPGQIGHLWWWNAAIGQYEFPGTGSTALMPGRAYWSYLTAPASVNLGAQ